jgi:uncharacterized protein YneF (UPF0154 family)
LGVDVNWDVLNLIIGIVAGLITGLATGYYFERRQTRAARAENAQLTEELESLKATMSKLNVNVIGTMPGRERRTLPGGDSLADAIVKAAKRMVDGTGRVRLGLLYEKFCAEEFTVDEVDAAIQSLVDDSQVVRDRDFLEVTV